MVLISRGTRREISGKISDSVEGRGRGEEIGLPFSWKSPGKSVPPEHLIISVSDEIQSTASETKIGSRLPVPTFVSGKKFKARKIREKFPDKKRRIPFNKRR